eukprot:181788-Hanusia_phi.AAC.3
MCVHLCGVTHPVTHQNVGINAAPLSRAHLVPILAVVVLVALQWGRPTNGADSLPKRPSTVRPSAETDQRGTIQRTAVSVIQAGLERQLPALWTPGRHGALWQLVRGQPLPRDGPHAAAAAEFWPPVVQQTSRWPRVITDGALGRYLSPVTSDRRLHIVGRPSRHARPGRLRRVVGLPVAPP